MNPFDLGGRVAIVTGGNGGIGLGIARGLAAAGADVAIAARNPTKSAAACSQLEALGARAVAISVDVTDQEQVRTMVADTVRQLGGVDILVANAGINIRRAPDQYLLEEWRTIVDTNLTGVFACCQAVYPEMRRRGGGKILTIGSMTSLFGWGRTPVYSTTKGGVVLLTKSLASAWAADNIQVNCILPGWIDTELTRGARQHTPELHDRVLERTPARRWGDPEDLAGPALFYCSPASAFVTGTALPVDGGFSSSMF